VRPPAPAAAGVRHDPIDAGDDAEQRREGLLDDPVDRDRTGVRKQVVDDGQGLDHVSQ
jgi:hypothetical protein